MTLPTGENLRDLTKLSDAQVQHEYDLCYEVLHGIYIDNELIIKGMLYEDATHLNNYEQFNIALNSWKFRLERAKDELVDRMILS